MNPTPPSLPGSPGPVKTSALAIWSLILGIGAVTCVCTMFTTIPGIICGHLALDRIKRSGGALTGRGMAVAGLVMSYLGLVLLVLMIPMAIPNFIKARQMAQRNVCIEHLREIDAAKQTWAMENKKQATDIPKQSDLAPYLKHGMPTCIAGGTYQINAVNQSPTCSIPGHKLE